MSEEINVHLFSSETVPIVVFTVRKKEIKQVILPGGLRIGESTFNGWSNLKSVHFGENTTIAQFAFKGCVALETIIFPRNVQVEDFAFSYCLGLTSVSVLSGASFGQQPFYGCDVNQLKVEGCTEEMKTMIAASELGSWDLSRRQDGIHAILRQDGIHAILR